ncbi:hypothetical protein [Acinetobacter seifertii]|uniref:hypothetical protein n=1 Tax=Acinetobacter seifertii TaxID=1530123 RepID=UPI0032B5A867
MPKFLAIAEKIYKKFEEDKLFSDNLIEQLNNLVSMIRKEIKGTPCKLKYNFIDFEECLSKPLNECAIKIDMSLIPKYKNKSEYIMWLASFIAKITIGGQPKLPSLSSIIAADFNVKKEAQRVLENKKAVSEENVRMIENYFNSDEYKKNNKKINLV